MQAALSFIFFLSLFSVVGLLSVRKSTGTTEDYLVAGRTVSPWLTALSSVATNNSGFMFIGLLGFAYRFGVQAVWLQAGWVVGDLFVWLWVHGRVREISGRLEISSVTSLLATRDDGKRERGILIVAGLLTFIFLGGYAAAQFRAGSLALEQLFGWPPWAGATLGATIVTAYCFSGGLRASIWTDAVQSFVMFGSMLLLTTMAMVQIGGPSNLMTSLATQDPSLVEWLPQGLAFGFGLYFLGFVVAGFGAVGQPHILVRSMAICSVDAIPAARRVYFAWFIPFNILAVLAGLCGRVLLPDLVAAVPAGASAAAAEQTLPLLANLLLPQVLVGLVLAGLFSATMSTADSQVLACSAVVTQDLAPHLNKSSFASKAATLAVTSLALFLAIFAQGGVFDLVLVAWSALGASLGPLMVLRVAGRDVGSAQGVVMMVAGLATVFAWGASPWAGDIFKLLPGMLVPFTIHAIWSAVESRTLANKG